MDSSDSSFIPCFECVLCEGDNEILVRVPYGTLERFIISLNAGNENISVKVVNRCTVKLL